MILDDLSLMRRMDELYIQSPFYGSRRMVAVLRQDGPGKPQAGAATDAADGDRGDLPQAKHVEGGPGHKIYPYLLRGLAIERPNQVWWPI